MAVSRIRPRVGFGVTSGDDFSWIPDTAVKELTIRMDIDRVDWITADAKVGPISRELLISAEPRKSAAYVSIAATAYSETGSVAAMWPGVDGYAADPTGASLRMWPRSMTVDYLTGELSLTAASGESTMRDNIRLGVNPYDTGKTTLFDLAAYAAEAGTPIDRMGAASVPIPAGDRRVHNPGQSMWDLIESEMSAAGGRLFMTTGLNTRPALAARDDPPRDTTITSLVMSTHPSLPGIPVESVVETRERDGDWASGIIVQFEYTNSAGDRITQYQNALASGGTEESRGLLIRRDRPAPSANLAAQILQRALRRGQSFEIVAPIDFRVRPGVNLTLARLHSTIDLGMCRSVEYRVHEGRMTVSTQIDQPIDE